MSILLGPILYARASTPSTWCFRIGAYLGSVPAAEPCPARLNLYGVAGARASEPKCVADFMDSHPSFEKKKGTFWAWDVDVPRGNTSAAFAYTISGEGIAPVAIEGVAIPAKGATPKMAMFSCNGVSSEKYWNRLKSPYELWDRMREQHLASPFHLLIGGGDQIYGDELMARNMRLRHFKKLPFLEQLQFGTPPGFAAEIRREYVRLYMRNWTGRGFAEMAARVPGAYTWDDHDIFDGWGSHPVELQSTPLFQHTFNAAAAAFSAFQLGGGHNVIDGSSGHFLQAVRIEGTNSETEILLLDLRSGRTLTEVMSRPQWESLGSFRQAHATRGVAGRRRHLLVVSSIPLVYRQFASAGEVVGEAVDLSDDILDQWEASPHRAERKKLILDLLQHRKDANCAVTILSGDVHVGALAKIRSKSTAHRFAGEDEAVIDQITSSGILHPQPSSLEYAGILATSKPANEKLDEKVRSEIVIPLGKTECIVERNWVEILPDGNGLDKKARLAFRFEAEAQGSIPVPASIEPPAV